MSQNGESSRARRESDASSSSSDASAAPVDLRPDQEWADVTPDEEELTFKSLVDDKAFSSFPEMLDHCKSAGLDVQGAISQHKLEFLDCIRMINFIRQTRAQTGTPPSQSSLVPTSWTDEKYLQPVLEDDAVLFTLSEIAYDPDSAPDTNSSTDSPEALRKRLAELEEETSRLRADFAAYRAQVSSTLAAHLDEQDEQAIRALQATHAAKNREYDQDYFDSYSFNSIHEIMLKDTVRTDGYRDFIYSSKSLFTDALVLDIGCGTGILSLFAAKAGAAHVYAVDNSAIIDKARAIVHANGLSSKISCIRGKAEDLVLPLPSNRSIDVIVSEWMGYALLYEAMLPSVLAARDKFLAPTGTMAPSHATIRVAPLAAPDLVADTVGFWGEVYGFDMRAMAAGAVDEVLVTTKVEATDLAAQDVEVVRFDLNRVQANELAFAAGFEFELERDVEVLDGFVLWFDTFFLRSRDAVLPVNARAERWREGAQEEGSGFSTGPRERTHTHWQYCVLLVDRSRGSKGVPLTKGQKITGRISYVKAKDYDRAVDIVVEWDAVGTSERGTQTWSLK